MTFASDSAGITTEKVEGEAVLRDRSLAKEDTGGGSESVQMDGAGRRERSRTESESQDEVGQAETPERKHGGGVLKVALIAAVVVFGLAILGMIVGRGGSHDATIMGETEPMNPFINENGYPNLPAVVEATLSDQWVIGDDENGDSGFVHDIGLEPAEDGDGYGTVKQSYLGFEKYKLDVIDLPDEGEDGVNVVNFMYQEPWDTTNLTPPGLTISNGNIYVRDDTSENMQGEYLGFIGDESAVDEVNENYLACTGTPDIVGYQTSDAWELLSLLGIDRSDITETKVRYQRISLEGAYMLDWVGLEGMTESSSATQRWGYLYNLYGKTEVAGREFYVGVEAWWSAVLEPVSEHPWYDTQYINDVQLTTESLHPEISVMLSTFDLFETDDMEAEGSENTEFEYVQYSNDPFPENSKFNYGLYPMDSSTKQIFGMADGVGSDGKEPDETDGYSGDSQNSGYQSVPYEDLLTYPENYLGTRVVVTGSVAYYPEEGLALDLGPGSGISALVTTNGLSYEFSDFKPIVTVYGTFNGLDNAGTTIEITADSVQEN